MARRPSPRHSAPQAARLFRLLGEPTRLRALLLLEARGTASVKEIVAALGRPRPAVSAHLQLLRRCGVVERRRARREVLYRITSPAALRLLRAVEGA
jgi:DNA-binding transcriptional ArsR family regulator